MQLRALALNSELHSALVNSIPALKAAASEKEPFGCYDYLSLYHPEERTAMMELIIRIETSEGFITINCIVTVAMNCRWC